MKWEDALQCLCRSASLHSTQWCLHGAAGTEKAFFEVFPDYRSCWGVEDLQYPKRFSRWFCFLPIVVTRWKPQTMVFRLQKSTFTSPECTAWLFASWLCCSCMGLLAWGVTQRQSMAHSCCPSGEETRLSVDFCTTTWLQLLENPCHSLLFAIVLLSFWFLFLLLH